VKGAIYQANYCTISSGLQCHYFGKGHRIMNHQSPSPCDDANLTVNLIVSLHKVWDEQCIINLKLSNTSGSNLELFTDSLPWVGLYSMVLVVANSSPVLDPVPHPFFLVNAIWGFTTINPGESLEGEIRLAWRFPDLVEMLKTRDMILFWAYQPTTANQTRGKWVGGWLLLPKLL
jgi:hypothetical protein